MGILAPFYIALLIFQFLCQFLLRTKSQKLVAFLELFKSLSKHLKIVFREDFFYVSNDIEQDLNNQKNSLLKLFDG